MNAEFSAPSRDNPFARSKRGEEFLVKNMLETNKTGSQILKDSAEITKIATQTPPRLKAAGSQAMSRSAQMYNKRMSFSKLPDEDSSPAAFRKPVLTRTKTLENEDTLGDEPHSGLDSQRKQLEDLKKAGGGRTPGQDGLGMSINPEVRSDLKSVTAVGRGLLWAAQNSSNKDLNMFTNTTTVSPVVAQRSAKIDKILKDWETKLLTTEKKLTKDKQAREVLAADLTLMQEELRKVNSKLMAKTEQLTALDTLLTDTKDAADRITRSMQGLTAALEREKHLRFK